MRKIYYLCDRIACENCREECEHTENIEHAKNFICMEEKYIETPTDFKDVVEEHSEKIDGVLNNITNLIFLLIGFFSGGTIASIILELIKY